MTLTFPICARLTVPSVDQLDGSRCAVSAWITLRNYPSTEAQRCHSFPVITHTPQRPGQVTCRWAITNQDPRPPAYPLNTHAQEGPSAALSSRASAAIPPNLRTHLLNLHYSEIIGNINNEAISALKNTMEYEN